MANDCLEMAEGLLWWPGHQQTRCRARENGSWDCALPRWALMMRGCEASLLIAHCTWRGVEMGRDEIPGGSWQAMPRRGVGRTVMRASMT
jgi:hypothetical protein